MHLHLRLALFLLPALILAACQSSDPSATPIAGSAECESPLAPEAQDHVIVVPVAQDSDPLYTPLDTTAIYVTAMLPERCPGEVFPLVFHSHGYGGSRRTTLAADGTLYPADPGLSAVDDMTTALAHHDYVVISVDQRGQGESQPQNGGGYARLNDPNFETRDLRHVLDWAYDNAGDLQLWREDASGVDKDLRVGTLGYSYGGAMQMPLAALDARIDTIVPIATWHDLRFSLIASTAMKQSWIQTLCLFADIPSNGALIGTINTPAVATMCNKAGLTEPTAFTIRTLDDLIAAISAEDALPRPVSGEELLAMIDLGMGYFQRQQNDGLAWGFGESRAQLRAVPAMFLQGNRDGIFNLTEGYLNWRYFNAAGGDTRLISMESGHLTPVAAQVDGTLNCGGVQGVYAILAWYDHHLKGLHSEAFEQLPRMCISVQPTPNAPASEELGVTLEHMPIGSLSGSGALPVQHELISVDVSALDGEAIFEPLLSVEQDGYVLAGIPTAASIEVTAGDLAVHDAIAIIGLGLQRDGEIYLIDDQVAGFREGTHTTNHFIAAGDPVMLPAVGEKLEAGDEIGLLLYEQQVQYSTITAPSTLTTLLPGATISYVAGRPFPDPLRDTLTPLTGVATNPNPYTVEIRDMQLPVFKPGSYEQSQWSRPTTSD